MIKIYTLSINFNFRRGEGPFYYNFLISQGVY